MVIDSQLWTVVEIPELDYKIKLQKQFLNATKTTYLSRQKPIAVLRGGGLVKEIRSGSFVSVLQELVELLRLRKAGGGAIKDPPWPPKFASGLGRGLSCLLSVSVTDEFLDTANCAITAHESQNKTKLNYLKRVLLYL